ncbi:C40 family peptidase [Paenibacillus cymbidii]|uniref:C40 family peptidase n=1 Tax=Paenibacillus cymbidii TaxID=1639034 RepID=UPI001F199419|nr:C40 family peptidase [Paenibacillus cymbidii]
MKKAFLFVFAAVALFCFSAGTVFADSKLDRMVDAVSDSPYRWAGTTPKGFDCSGFTAYIFSQFNMDLPHSSKAQNSEGYWVSKSDLRKGDLVFFNTDGSGISHVGIYWGNGEFVHSATNIGVTIDRLDSKYYSTRYVSARRVLWDDLYNDLTKEIEEAQ